MTSLLPSEGGARPVAGEPPTKRALRLLPPEALVATSGVDHADWNFRPFLGFIQRARFHLILDLLGATRFRRLLEVGYGSGVFLPELARHCDRLYGVDAHGRAAEVARTLLTVGVGACLVQASAAALPFQDGQFDCLVAVSVIEFIDGLESAARELRRVLAPGGILVLVTPAHSRLADLGLKVLTGKAARDDYADRREAVLPTLLRYFRTVEKRTFPPRWMELLSTRLYTGLRLQAGE